MIDFLRGWIEQVTIAVIIVSIFEMILPSGKTKKYIKMILGVFIVFSIIAPFVDSSALYNLDVNEIIGNYTENITSTDITSQNSVDDRIEEMYIRELENDISNTIQEQGYNVKSCEIDAIIYSEEEEAGINSINIVLLSKNSKSDGIEEVNEIKININIDNENKVSEDDNSITEKDIKSLKNYLSDYYEIDKKIININ